MNEYSRETLDGYYAEAASWNRDRVQTMQVSNPQSPLQLYPRTSVVDVRVKSVSPLGPSAALVRFDTVRTDTGAQPQLANSFVAVTRYRYSTAPMSVDDRFANPLGFQ